MTDESILTIEAIEDVEIALSLHEKRDITVADHDAERRNRVYDLLIEFVRSGATGNLLGIPHGAEVVIDMQREDAAVVTLPVCMLIRDEDLVALREAVKP